MAAIRSTAAILWHWIEHMTSTTGSPHLSKALTDSRSPLASPSWMRAVFRTCWRAVSMLPPWGAPSLFKNRRMREEDEIISYGFNLDLPGLNWLSWAETGHDRESLWKHTHTWTHARTHARTVVCTSAWAKQGQAYSIVVMQYDTSVASLAIYVCTYVNTHLQMKSEVNTDLVANTATCTLG